MRGLQGGVEMEGGAKGERDGGIDWITPSCPPSKMVEKKERKRCFITCKCAAAAREELDKMYNVVNEFPTRDIKRCYQQLCKLFYR